MRYEKYIEKFGLLQERMSVKMNAKKIKRLRAQMDDLNKRYIKDNCAYQVGDIVEYGAANYTIRDIYIRLVVDDKGYFVYHLIRLRTDRNVRCAKEMYLLDRDMLGANIVRPVKRRKEKQIKKIENDERRSS